jgi:pyruvate kinase
LDGTDCIMLSGESAMGKYPEEAVAMLARIAAYTETHRPSARSADRLAGLPPATAAEAMAGVVEHALETVPCAAVFVPTKSGTTARLISRFNPPMWVVTVCPDHAVSQGLAFSFGVWPLTRADDPENWRDFAREWLRENGIPGAVAMLAAGPSPRQPDANHRLEFLRVGDKPAAPSP